MGFSAKIADFIQSQTIFGKHFMLDLSQGYEYAFGEAKQNPGALSLIPQKISTAVSANFFHF